MVDAAGRETAGGECGGGFKHGVFERNLRVDDTEYDGGTDDENERHHHDGVGLIDDLEGDGLLTEFDFAFSLDGGEK